MLNLNFLTLNCIVTRQQLDDVNFPVQQHEFSSLGFSQSFVKSGQCNLLHYQSPSPPWPSPLPPGPSPSLCPLTPRALPRHLLCSDACCCCKSLHKMQQTSQDLFLPSRLQQPKFNYVGKFCNFVCYGTNMNAQLSFNKIINEYLGKSIQSNSCAPNL